MSFLIDTDICSAYLKNSSVVFSRFVQYSGRLHVSIITVGELTAWTLRASAPPARAQAMIDMLCNVAVLPLDNAVATKFGELRAQTLDQGRRLPPLDLFMAATACLYNDHGDTQRARLCRNPGPEGHRLALTVKLTAMAAEERPSTTSEN